jgi:threonyl-tRNA synthetase
MAGAISVRLPDGSNRELAEGTTAADLALAIGPRLAKAAVVATIDGHEVDLNTPLADGDEVAIITGDTDAGREVLRHSTAHWCWRRPCCVSARGQICDRTSD